MMQAPLVLLLPLLLLLADGFIAPTSGASDCLPSKEHKARCDATEYEKYVSCVRGRIKRSPSTCDDGCQGSCGEQCKSCDCGQCYDDSDCDYDDCQVSSCCNTCCNTVAYQRCKTNHCCHKTCHAECKTSNCRKSCRRSCYDSIDHHNKEITYVYSNGTVYSPGGGNSTHTTNNTISSHHNITTIINLKNIINNTQLIEVPINMNYTHQNNITLREYAGGYYGGDSGGTVINNTVIYMPNNTTTTGTSTDQCCTIIGPKQCQRTKEYPGIKCFHTRSKQCGELCTADIMHVERRQVCFGGAPQSDCREQVIYIPQPRPKCVYQYQWPYVACGVQVQANCEGCYGHYSDKSSQEYTQCPMQCYNDFGGTGPYYRQGPYYQPSYSHQGPCYYGDCGYGGGGYNPGYGMPSGGGFQYQGGGYPPMGSYIQAPPEEEIPIGGQMPYPNYYNNTGMLDPMVNVMMPPAAMMQMPLTDPRREVQIQAEIEDPREFSNASYVPGSEEVYE